MLLLKVLICERSTEYCRSCVKLFRSVFASKIDTNVNISHSKKWNWNQVLKYTLLSVIHENDHIIQPFVIHANMFVGNGS